MPFERLSFPEGEPVAPSKLHEDVSSLASVHSHEFVRLSPGEYDLTPEAWETSNFTHHLTVYGDDIAIYAMKPRHEDSAAMDAGRPEQGFETGGRVFKMPEDRRFAVIMAPALKRTVRVYEIITYVE